MISASPAPQKEVAFYPPEPLDRRKQDAHLADTQDISMVAETPPSKGNGCEGMYMEMGSNGRPEAAPREENMGDAQ